MDSASTNSNLNLRSVKARAGFTLIEMVLTLSVTSILLLSMMSVMRILGKAVPSGTDAAKQALDITNALSRMRSDIEVASEITFPAGAVLQLSVPDRTGDGVDDVVRYSVVTNKLQIQVNGSAGATLLEDVSSVDASSVPSSTAVAGTPIVEWLSPQVLMAAHAGVLVETTHQTELRGMELIPILPSDAVAWRITAIEIPLRRASSNVPVVNVAIRRLAPVTGVVTAVELQTTTQTLTTAPSSTSSPSAFTFSFSSPATLAPTDRVCFVLSTSTSANGIQTFCNEPIPFAYGDHLRSSGGAWERNDDRAIPCRVWVSVQRPKQTTKEAITTSGVQIDISMLDGSVHQSLVQSVIAPEET